jgi:hypothetical protein
MQDRLYKYKDLVEAHLQQYCTTGTGTYDPFWKHIYSSFTTTWWKPIYSNAVLQVLVVVLVVCTKCYQKIT